MASPKLFVNWDSDGNEKSNWLDPSHPTIAPYVGVPAATKRVTLPIGTDGVLNNTASGLDYNQRTLIQLPVTTTQWRMRWRNASAMSGAVAASSWDGVGVWVGAPAMGTAGYQWGRTFSAAPLQALGAFTTPADGSDWVSPWVTDAALQFQRGIPLGVSTGITHSASTLFYYSTQGWTFSGAGRAAVAGNAAPFAGTPSNFIVGDWRIEYEFSTPSGTAGVSVGVCIGDSITSGWTSDTSNPALTPPAMSGYDPHMGWPGAAGTQNGFAWVNMGVGSTQAGGSLNWNTGTGWRWDRADIATTIPDFAIVALGTNDVNASRAPATIQQDIQTIITLLKQRGISEVYLGTITPRNFAGQFEIDRVAMNNWMRNMPCGIAGVFDFDKTLYLQATPATADADYIGSLGYPHPNRAGYQRMASAVNRTKQ